MQTHERKEAMRLIDRVRLGKYHVHPDVLNYLPELQSKLAVSEALGDTVPINIQNIDDWLRTVESETSPLGPNQLIGLRPSFEHMWFEWQHPCGSLNAAWVSASEAHWEFVFFAERGGGAVVTLNWSIDLESDGLFFNEPTSLTEQDDICVQAVSFVVFVAQSLMLCKNVQIIEQPKPEAVIRKFRRKHGGVSPSKYREVVIKPMQEVVRKAGGFKKLGIEKAMHIVRGHFRDYSPERPLFGKTAGRFFFHSHVRGDSRLGVKPPAYEVRSPSGSLAVA
jgi:hypothetical protein